ncbi:AtpZ/AtpI family protein [uncultured Chitinophaga sp.]|uniref:AtpZ/AtpI family protein n=1 Tax=uncultured Chitinophaga sp. TaxID=339340 RepID=UPI0026276A27|nr:AtpZ/AtpI family protein [uncultured Chitinophaga sp.]
MKSPSSKKKPLQEKKPDGNKLLLRYAGLAFQMMATLGLAIFVGYKIDQRTGWPFPVFMIIFSLLGLTLLLWQIIKDTRRNE